MQDSFVKTYAVPVAPTTSPLRVANATDVPMRLVLDTNGNTVTLAYSVNDLTPTVTTDSFGPVATITLILAPRQTLYAVASAANTQLSVAASEAYPVL